MKKKLSLLATAIAFFAVSSVATASVECLVPYMGVDAQYRHMGFKKNLGHNIFRNHNPQANAYVGLKLNDYIGFELGYEYAWKRSGNRANGAGAIELGDPRLLAPGNINYSTNSSRIHGSHISLVAFKPFCVCDDYFEIYASVGIANLKLKSIYQPTAFSAEGQLLELTPEELNETRISFSKHKTVLRLGLGLNYMMHECAGIRLGVIWEDTSRFRNLRPKSGFDLVPRASLKDSFIYNLGIFWRFH